MKVIYNYAVAPDFEADLEALAQQGIAVTVCPESEDSRLFELLASADALWHCLRPVNRAVMDAAPNLKLVQKIGVGVNTIDLEYAKARGIAVCNMPGTNSSAVAEHVLALTLRYYASYAHSMRRFARTAAGPGRRNDRIGSARFAARQSVSLASARCPDCWHRFSMPWVQR
ncbi:MAG: hypothetical protein HC809_08490 [Gammaproteobacteria bacterium]|nr:hypothetical protein [Gammaproteobacteria bacterium]